MDTAEKEQWEKKVHKITEIFNVLEKDLASQEDRFFCLYDNAEELDTKNKAHNSFMKKLKKNVENYILKQCLKIELFFISTVCLYIVGIFLDMTTIYTESVHQTLTTSTNCICSP